MMLNGKKLIGWLPVLALAPVVGWGQEELRFIQHPQNVTVCVEESAVFRSEVVADSIKWFFNGVAVVSLPDSFFMLKRVSGGITGNTAKVEELTVQYNNSYNGAFVQIVAGDNSFTQDIESILAYLFYEPNRQFPVTGLITAVNNETAQLDWDEYSPSLTTQYLLGVYDADNSLVANYTTNATHITYDLPLNTDLCQQLTFKVTADVCPDPDEGFVQTEATTFNLTINCATEPETEVSGENSGTHVLVPSSLLVLAAAATMNYLAASCEVSS